MDIHERKTTTLRALYETVTRYIDDNRHSRDVNERWLCSMLELQLGILSGLLNHRPRDLDKQPIADFRSAKMQKEIESKRKELEQLERDLVKHQHAAA